MRTKTSLCVLLFVGLALGCATAPPAPSSLTPEQQRIEQLLASLELPRYAEKLEEVALRVAGHPQDEKLPEDEQLRPRIETQLAPDAVVSDVVRRVAADFDAAYVSEIEHFNASALGNKVREAAGVPYSWFSRLGYRLFGGLSDDSPERVALVRRLDELTLSRDTSIDLYLKLHSSILRWYQAKGFIDPKESEAVGGIHGLMTTERERAEAAGTKHAIPFGLYSLSDLSTPELAEYVEQAGSPASQWFAKAVRKALTETIGERAEAIAR